MLEIRNMNQVVRQILLGNSVVAKRWFSNGYTIESIISETNELIVEYNRKYGKRFGSFELIK